MNEAKIKAVKDSFDLVAPIAGTAAELFYGRLFELDPTLKALFKGDMQEQGAKLMKMISVAVSKLDDLETLVPVLENLAIRHIDYDVKAKDYETVGAALLWTLEKGLGDAYTPEVAEAWTETYTLMSSTMIAAAYQPETA